MQDIHEAVEKPEMIFVRNVTDMPQSLEVYLGLKDGTKVRKTITIAHKSTTRIHKYFESAIAAKSRALRLVTS